MEPRRQLSLFSLFFVLFGLGVAWAAYGLVRGAQSARCMHPEGITECWVLIEPRFV